MFICGLVFRLWNLCLKIEFFKSVMWFVIFDDVEDVYLVLFNFEWYLYVLLFWWGWKVEFLFGDNVFLRL